MTTAVDVLSQRALNRALLARQGLLQRWQTTVVEAVERLVGLQAQAPIPPYFALWTRIAGFRPADLGDALLARQVVRSSLQRGTIHLVTPRDSLEFRALLQPMLRKHFTSIAAGKLLAGLDLDAVVCAGTGFLRERPRTNAELGPLLAERWPRWDGSSLAQVVQFLAPTVQIPPRGVWGQSGQATWALAEDWLGQTLDWEPSLDDLVRRYLGAFGPASIADAQKWSGLTGLKPVFTRLRSGLVTFKDERGREFFDLPGAPRPEPETPAPVRYLGEFDNVLLSYADRSRIIRAEDWPRIYTANGIIRATILVDGMVRGKWTIERTGKDAILTIEPFGPIDPGSREALVSEGLDLLAFAAADAPNRSVRFLDV